MFNPLSVMIKFMLCPNRVIKRHVKGISGIFRILSIRLDTFYHLFIMYFLHKYYHIGVRVSFSQRGE